MGGGGTRTVTAQQPSESRQRMEFPPEVQALFNLVLPQLQTFMENVPLNAFAGAQPRNIPWFNPTQEGAMRELADQPALSPMQLAPLAFFSNQMSAPRLTADEAAQRQGLIEQSQRVAPGFNPTEQLALESLKERARALPGQAAATTAMRDYLDRNFRTETLPTLQNEMALAGLGTSGALGESVRRAQGNLQDQMVPFLLEEARDRGRATTELADLGGRLATRGETADLARERAFGGLGALGGLSDTRGSERANQAFNVGSIVQQAQAATAGRRFDIGEMIRGLMQEQQDANLADRLRRQDLTTGITGGVTGTLLPASLTSIGNVSKLRGMSNTRGGGLLGGMFTGSAK